MRAYLRLLRLEDQYLQIGAILASALLFDLNKISAFWWIVAATCISFVGFIINEFTDRHDTDKNSWNSVHVKSWKMIKMPVVLVMIAGFSLLAFLLAYALDTVYWTGIMWFLAIAYSLKPLRFKAVFALDIFSQLAVWIVIPFLALVWGNSQAIYLGLMSAGFFWCVFYPYQIADYDADKKAKIHPTHIVLGIKQALGIGLISGVLATLLYLLNPSLWSLVWLWPFAAVLGIVLFQYIVWLKMKSAEKLLKSMQLYAKIMNPLGRLMVLGMAVYYFIVQST